MITPSEERVTSGVLEALRRRGRSPELALQHLIDIQSELSHIPASAIVLLAEQLGVTRSHLWAAVDFYAFLHREPRGDYDIRISDNITDRMAGNQELMAHLCDRLACDLGVPRADGRVCIDFTSCTGMCDQGPAALINGMAVTRIDSSRANLIAGLIEAHVPMFRWPPELFEVVDNIHRPGLLLEDRGRPDAGLKAVAERGAETVLGEIERSGLRGRGGAGFTTALKWRFCREAEGDERIVVCNADEGEPGTFKDRVLLNAYADRVFEGMAVCARIIGATKGYLYLRGEYRYLLDQLNVVLAKRREAGLLGEEILGIEGFDFDIDIHLGAGAYICGEESALIESLEGKRGITRKRPPFPVTSGFLGRPTVVNNVETFLAAARIAELGGYWFRGEGTDESAGSKILSISGDCLRPGIYEYPFGTSVRQILAECGAVSTQAVQVSGAAGITLSRHEIDRRIAFEDLPTAGSFMVFDQGRDMMDMVRNFAEFFEHESCGFCTPCRVGSVLLKDLIEKVAIGKASSYDLNEIRHISEVMRQSSHCGLGHTAPNHVLHTLEKFPGIYEDRLASAEHTPSFDLDAALADARAITGRHDAGAHLSAAAHVHSAATHVHEVKP